MKQPFKEHFLHGVFGLAMGYILSRIGFGNYTEVHKMFIFADLRMFLTFAGAVGITMVGFLLVARGKKIPSKVYSKGTVLGGAIFGVGWAITGACPSTALVQLGEGRLAAVFSVLGILFGVWMYRRIAKGSVKFDTGVCGEA